MYDDGYNSDPALEAAAARQRAIFRRRRLLLLLIVLLFLVGAIMLWRGLSGSSAPADRGPASASASGTALTAAADTGVISASVPVADKRCLADQVKVTVSADRQTSEASHSPAFSVAVKNISAGECRINVGSAAQNFILTAQGGPEDGKKLWSSQVCQVEPRNLLITLHPNQVLHSEALQWQRDTGDSSNCGKPEAQRQKVAAGNFVLTATVDGFTSDPYPLTLE